MDDGGLIDKSNITFSGVAGCSAPGSVWEQVVTNINGVGEYTFLQIFWWNNYFLLRSLMKMVWDN